MSRILRRPIFRGGRVSSYGTGIASGLADGGRVGYANAGTVTGGDLLRKQGWQWDPLPRMQDYLVSGARGVKPGDMDWWNQLITRQNLEKLQSSVADEVQVTEDLESQDPYQGSRSELFTPRKQVIDDVNILEPAEFTSDAELEDESAVPTIPETKGRVFDVKDPLAYAESTGVPAGVRINEGEVVIEEDSGIEAMADKYFALMGGDKAWQRDATDMLMSAGSKWLKEGATVRSGASEFLAEEAAKGPGRAETIRKDATKLAITQDVQMDFLQKKLDSAESIAEKNIIAQQMRDLNKSYAPGITQKDIEYGTGLEKGGEKHTMWLINKKLSPTLASEAKSRATDPTNLAGAMTTLEVNALGPIYYSDWQGIFNPETSKADGTYLDAKEKKIIKFEGGELISSENIEIQ